MANPGAFGNLYRVLAELLALIPTIVLLFGTEIKVAGSLSLAVSLVLSSIVVWCHAGNDVSS